MLFFMNLHSKIMSGLSNREIKHQVLIVRLQDWWCWTFSATVFPAPADLTGRGKLSASLLLFKGLALSFYILCFDLCFSDGSSCFMYYTEVGLCMSYMDMSAVGDRCLLFAS